MRPALAPASPLPLDPAAPELLERERRSGDLTLPGQHSELEAASAKSTVEHPMESLRPEKPAATPGLVCRLPFAVLLLSPFLLLLLVMLPLRLVPLLLFRLLILLLLHPLP